MIIILPQYKQYTFLDESGLCYDAVYNPADKQMRHLDFKNIFASGDATAFSVPKLVHIAVIPAYIAAKTFVSDLGKKVEIPAFEPAELYIMERSGRQATMI